MCHHQLTTSFSLPDDKSDRTRIRERFFDFPPKRDIDVVITFQVCDDGHIYLEIAGSFTSYHDGASEYYVFIYKEIKVIYLGDQVQKYCVVVFFVRRYLYIYNCVLMLASTPPLILFMLVCVQKKREVAATGYVRALINEV